MPTQSRDFNILDGAQVADLAPEPDDEDLRTRAVTASYSRTARVPSGVPEMSRGKRHRSTSLHLARR
jgi:hypothetical protein